MLSVNHRKSHRLEDESAAFSQVDDLVESGRLCHGGITFRFKGTRLTVRL